MGGDLYRMPAIRLEARQFWTPVIERITAAATEMDLRHGRRRRVRGVLSPYRALKEAIEAMPEGRQMPGTLRLRWAGHLAIFVVLVLLLTACKSALLHVFLSCWSEGAQYLADKILRFAVYLIASAIM